MGKIGVQKVAMVLVKVRIAEIEEIVEMMIDNRQAS